MLSLVYQGIYIVHGNEARQVTGSFRRLLGPCRGFEEISR